MPTDSRMSQEPLTFGDAFNLVKAGAWKIRGDDIGPLADLLVRIAHRQRRAGLQRAAEIVRKTSKSQFAEDIARAIEREAGE